MAPPSPPSGWRNTGSRVLDKLKSYWADEEAAPPPITERTALFCAILFTIAYIAPFYLSPTLRASPLNSRDSPAVIVARMRAVVLTCVASTAFTIYILAALAGASTWDILRLTAFWPIDVLDIGKVMGLVMILFVGPLYESLVVDGEWRHLTPGAVKEHIWTDLRGLRAIVVAPISEELVFRSLTISLYLVARASPQTIILKTPLIFGLAHVHHLVEFLQTYTPPNRRLPSARDILVGLVRTGFQFTYTSLFGIFAAFVYVRTGNVWAAILAHSFCNKMGLPRMRGRVGQYADMPMQDVTPDVAQGKKQDDAVEMKAATEQSIKVEELSRSLGVGWSVVYYALLLVGSFAFYKLLWPMTESSNALLRV